MTNILLYCFFTSLCGPVYGLAADNMQKIKIGAPPKWVRVGLWCLVFLSNFLIRPFQDPEIAPANHLFFPIAAAAILIGYFFFYESSLLCTLTIHLMLMVAVASAELIGALMVWLCFHRLISGDITQPDMLLASLAGAFASIACLFLVTLLWRHFQMKKRLRRGSLMVAMMSLCLLLPSYFYCFFIVQNNGTLARIHIIPMAIALIFNLMLICIQFRLAEKDELAQKVDELRHQGELSAQHYQNIEARREELAKLRHDYNNQLSAILMLLQNGQTQQAEEALRDLLGRIGQTREYPYCGISIVNAVLSEKESECRKQGIQLKTDLLFPEQVDISPLDLCSIFSNLLDNAIRACKSQPGTQPCIQLAVATQGDYLLIRCENPAVQDHRSHPDGTGWGMRILKDIAAAHDGDFQTDFSDNLFTARLILLSRKRPIE